MKRWIGKRKKPEKKTEIYEVQGNLWIRGLKHAVKGPHLAHQGMISLTFSVAFLLKKLSSFLTNSFWHIVHGIWQTAHKFGEFKVTNLANLAAQFGANFFAKHRR
jgi:hypothetical protein